MPIIIHGHRGLTTRAWANPERRLIEFEFAWNLITCRNRTIACEAGLAVYELNKFEFPTKSSWQALHDFLLMIGEANRHQLRSLVLQPDLVGCLHPFEDRWVILAEGGEELLRYEVLIEFMSPTMDVKPRNFLAPTIEACFRLLGRIGPEPTLRIDVPVDLDFLVIPRSQFILWDDMSEPCDTGTAIYVEAVEQVCRDHTTRQIGQINKVKLLWKNLFTTIFPN